MSGGAPSAVGPAPATVRLEAFGTDAVLVLADGDLAGRAEAVARAHLEAVDRACSRFRPDAEIAALEDRAGTWVTVGPVLFDALEAALAVAGTTRGAVVPTVGACLAGLGYDRDFAAVDPWGGEAVTTVPAANWRLLELDERRQAARVARGVRLDLGATAKALAADRVAAMVAALGTGVAVSLGGDVAVAGGPPRGGWSIGVGADSGTDAVDEVVTISSGGLASSSTELRSWRREGRRLHHIVDPRTGDSAPVVWRLVTVAAPSCLDANAAATAAVVWGERAPARLTARGLAARLVGADGTVVTTPGWPAPAGGPGRADGARP
ncbi:MAG: FAD:protein FMN transferase [Acidobacteriota bacterium]|nr:FAD:protein FMN transferase [Acidobacteriota bacterium]